MTASRSLRHLVQGSDSDLQAWAFEVEGFVAVDTDQSQKVQKGIHLLKGTSLY